MQNNIQIIIEPEDAGTRLDKLISVKADEITRSAAEKLIVEGCVSMNGKALNKSYRGAVGDCIDVVLPEPVKLDVLPEDISLQIMYEDSDLLVVNKPKGMVVHPAPGNYSGTLVNALLAHCGDSLSGINGVIRPGIVHRIDKDTSGLLIVAKNDFAHHNLAAQIKVHSFTRIYEAVVHGDLKVDDGTIDAPIGRNSIGRKWRLPRKMRAVPLHTITSLRGITDLLIFSVNLKQVVPIRSGFIWPILGTPLPVIQFTGRKSPCLI